MEGIENSLISYSKQLISTSLKKNNKKLWIKSLALIRISLDIRLEKLMGNQQKKKKPRKLQTT